MTDQAKISALAAELTRIGRMPSGFEDFALGTGCIEDEDAKKRRIYPDGEMPLIGIVHRPDVVLAALSGVAVELIAENQITILYYKLYGINGKANTEFDGWQINDWRIENYMVEDKISTYHEALVVALAQIKS